MEGSWLSTFMKRVVSLDDLEEEEGKAEKVARGAQEAPAPAAPPPKPTAGEISDHIARQKKFLLEGAPHVFWKRTFSKPTFCNFCTEFIWGLTEQGFSCEVCGYAVHTACLKDSADAIHKSCRITNLEWIFWGLPAPPEHAELAKRLLPLGSPFDLHHWVGGITAISAKCLFCAKTLTSFSLDGQRCSRCKANAHEECIINALAHKCVPPQSVLLYHPRPSPQNIPLLVFINSKSGGQQGEAILRKFKRILGPQQAYNLLTHKPEPTLSKWRSIPNVRILACGGDGTVAWILEALDRVDWHPPVGILPLGTGNDLSRTLGWGPGYEGERIHEILASVAQASIVSLDRWKITLTPTGPPPAAGDAKKAEPVVKIINNYFSIGVDAKVAHEFHTFREQKPELCASRVGNKLLYALGGMRAMFESGNSSLAANIVLEADGKRLAISPDIQGLIVLNVLTYAGGTDLWGKPDGFQQPRINDGMLEVVGITGTFHMGTITAKLSSAMHITQAKTLRIEWLASSSLPVQTDGEPWLQQPCVITIERLNQATMLCNGTPSANAAAPAESVQSPAFAIENFFDDHHSDDATASGEEDFGKGSLDSSS